MKLSLAEKPLMLITSAVTFVVLLVFASVGQKKGNPDLLHATPDELNQYARENFNQYMMSGQPKWELESWKDKCQVLLSVCDPLDAKSMPAAQFRLDNSLQIAPQVKLAPGGGTGINENNPTLQIVYYNAQAADLILNNQLFSKTALGNLRSQLAQGKISDLSIPDFDSKAVVVKTIWQVIYPEENESSTGYSGFYTYNKTVKYHSGEHSEQLLDMVNWPISYVDRTEPQQCRQKKLNSDSYVYTLGCFLFREISGEKIKHLPDNIGSYLLHGQCLANKCYLLFMGMHIITRETPNWVWMTYWWTNEGKASTADKWGFFEAAASTNNQEQTPIANPYLEGPTSGMASNCLDCHRFAAYNPSFTSKTGTQYGGDPAKMHAKDLQSPPCYFKDSLRTHFLWTIAVHQNDSIGQSSDPCPK